MSKLVKKDESQSTLPSHYIRTAKTHLPPRSLDSAISASVAAATANAKPTKTVRSKPVEITDDDVDETPNPFDEDDGESTQPFVVENGEEMERDCQLDAFQGFAVTCSACQVTHLVENLHSSLVPDRCLCICRTCHSEPATCAVSVLLNSSLGSKKRKSARRE